jgi:hypothetical protein
MIVNRRPVKPELADIHFRWGARVGRVLGCKPTSLLRSVKGIAVVQHMPLASCSVLLQHGDERGHYAGSGPIGCKSTRAGNYF